MKSFTFLLSEIIIVFELLCGFNLIANKDYSNGDRSVIIILMILALFPLGFLIMKDVKKSNNPNAKLEGFPIIYVNGLNVPSGTNGYVTLTKKELSYQLAGNQFNISIDKITYIGIDTETDIQNIATQSGTGMIIGAATFGLIGAMVGGRIKNKEKKIHKYFLVVNYESSEGDIKYIVSQVDSTIDKAKNLILECMKFGSMKHRQEIDL